MRAPAAPTSPLLEERKFSPQKAEGWLEEWGHVLPRRRFPYPAGKFVAVIMANWSVQWVWAGNLWRLSIPRGWVTDLGSIPRILVPIAGRVNSLGWPGPVAHDLLYHLLGRVPQVHGESWLHVWADGAWLDPRVPRLISRGEADFVLRDISLRWGTDPWKAWKAWMGVRLNLRAEWRWAH